MTDFKEYFGSFWFASPHWLFGTLPQDSPQYNDFLLSQNERCVLGYLFRTVRHIGDRWPSRENISRNTGISIPTVTRTIRSLKDRDLLQIMERSGRSHEYELNRDTLREWGRVFDCEYDRKHRESAEYHKVDPDHPDAGTPPYPDHSDAGSNQGDSGSDHCDPTLIHYKDKKKQASTPKGEGNIQEQEQEDFDLVALLMDTGFDRDSAVKMVYTIPESRTREQQHEMIRFQIKNLEMENECRRLENKSAIGDPAAWVYRAVEKKYKSRVEKLKKLREKKEQTVDADNQELVEHTAYRIWKLARDDEGFVERDERIEIGHGEYADVFLQRANNPLHFISADAIHMLDDRIKPDQRDVVRIDDTHSAEPCGKAEFVKGKLVKICIEEIEL